MGGGGRRPGLTYAQLGLLMRPALIDAGAGGVATRKGEPFSVAGVPVRDGRIVALDVLADPARLPRLDLAIRHN